ncbi:Microsomal signal peptidase 12 kDa subunit (SPC12) [Giardia duodenalis]|uniref:Signal peptidase complex subunit 1 n=1 Tax=Giardia intestinalis (strain ATCC 50803 / WB clone C6) TaxID=184922 RepID=A8BSQ8_GIAIC|nr:Microsomal signal peptidase 12 kDa subunit (SPC12) [Giardia intestinalis]KAE8305525.1 Microsomal signal peptidase 12 kDa subunit (SPC12) [Giardia intestinalis]|eukprot:XP_001705052.1 Hypothetical protein GL50803_3154 [Giardia lamblia ATCC 50803]
MDYRGQIRAGHLMRLIIILFALFGLLTAWAFKNMGIGLLVHAFGLCLAALATVPDWPYYNQMEIAWQPVRGRTERLTVFQRLLSIFQ